MNRAGLPTNFGGGVARAVYRLVSQSVSPCGLCNSAPRWEIRQRREQNKLCPTAPAVPSRQFSRGSWCTGDVWAINVMFLSVLVDFALDHQKIPPPPHRKNRLRQSPGPREFKRPLVCLNFPTTQREWNRFSHSNSDRAPVPSLTLTLLSKELQPPPHPGEILKLEILVTD